jgi:hypothetical protein
MVIFIIWSILPIFNYQFIKSNFIAFLLPFDDFSPLSSYNPLYLIMKSYLEKHYMQKVKTEPEKT